MGFLLFHDDSIANGNSWSTSYLNTNWNNAQKSTRFYFENKIKRIPTHLPQVIIRRYNKSRNKFPSYEWIWYKFFMVTTRKRQ